MQQGPSGPDVMSPAACVCDAGALPAASVSWAEKFELTLPNASYPYLGISELVLKRLPAG